MKLDVGIFIKIITAIVILVLCITVSSYFHPIMGANFAVDQLQDSYSSSVGVKFWQGFKNNWIYLYIVFVILLFANNFKDMFTKY